MNKWHFQFNIDVDEPNQLVYVKIYGIWREDSAYSYLEEFKKEVAAIIGKPWARLVDLSNWKTASDEVPAPSAPTTAEAQEPVPPEAPVMEGSSEEKSVEPSPQEEPVKS